jgi:hypothetical protein
LPARAAVASADAVDTRIQPIMPPCFTSCFRDPRIRPLLVAIRQSNENSHVEAVQMLIANGASTGGVYNEELLGLEDVPTPLILAIRKGRSDFVAMLLEHAASVDEGEREIEREREEEEGICRQFEERESADGGSLMRGSVGGGSSTRCMPLCTLKILKF